MLKINLGCGWRDFGKDWIHIDGGDYPHLDSKDICNLPYEDNSVDMIYASHVIEYFDREEIRPLLCHWHDKLKKGGTLRLAVPDFASMSQLYQDGICDLGSFLGPLYGKMKMQDGWIYHKTTYDEDSLSNLLHTIGYNDVVTWNWRDTEHSHFDDHSQAYIPHMDKEHGILISLNIQAKK
jgi:predicted SAM-dependent methyltransferase